MYGSSETAVEGSSEERVVVVRKVGVSLKRPD